MLKVEREDFAKREEIGEQIFRLVRTLNSPVHAGQALAYAIALTFKEAGLTSREEIDVAMNTMNQKVLRWSREIENDETLSRLS
jgi:hypothetical protein